MARVWEYKTGQMKVELRGGHDRQVEVAVFAPENSYPYIRELVGEQVRPSLRLQFPIRLNACHPKDNNNEPGVFVFTGGRDNLIIIWDAQSGRQLKTLVRAHYSSRDFDTDTVL